MAMTTAYIIPTVSPRHTLYGYNNAKSPNVVTNHPETASKQAAANNSRQASTITHHAHVSLVTSAMAAGNKFSIQLDSNNSQAQAEA